MELTTTVTGSSTTLTSSTAFFLGLDEGAARVGKGLWRLPSISRTIRRRKRIGWTAQDFFELFLLVAQGGQLLFDLDGLEPGQLAQADFQDVFGLPLT